MWWIIITFILSFVPALEIVLASLLSTSEGRELLWGWKNSIAPILFCISIVTDPCIYLIMYFFSLRCIAYFKGDNSKLKSRHVLTNQLTNFNNDQYQLLWFIVKKQIASSILFRNAISSFSYLESNQRLLRLGSGPPRFQNHSDCKSNHIPMRRFVF